MRRRLAPAAAFILLAGCGRYQEFQLPVRGAALKPVQVSWTAEPDPVLSSGAPGQWDSGDVLNPSVIARPGGFLNLYSGFDGSTWSTGLAWSGDGLHWTKQGKILTPSVSIEGDRYIAANGAAIEYRGELLYYYQGGRTPQIYLARQDARGAWGKRAQPVLGTGPYGSWDELGVADPALIEADGRLYLYYLGMDRARRQRLGVAMSQDGVAWRKLRSNPILELGEYGAFDGAGLGEPAVWAMPDGYWLLYTGRTRNEQRKLGLARSLDGVHWTKLDTVIAGVRPWDAQVLCDPSVIVQGGQVRVWFGGGDTARPDENIHGQIGYGVLTIQPR